jgi:DNA-binding NarL/FixJ family response regulator
VSTLNVTTARQLIDQQIAAGQPQSPDWDRRLSRRETLIVDLVGRGLANGEIATRISVSRLTVKSHLRRISQAIGCGQRAGIVGSVYRAGVLEPGTEPAAWTKDLRSRQREVVDLVSRGFTNAEIGRSLNLSREAVSSRLALAARLVECGERAGIVGAFFRAGVLR